MARTPHRKTRSSRSGTASADEVARFAAMADAWWDADGEFRPLHKLNPVRVAFVRDRVVGHLRLDGSAAQPFRGLDILDIGCGGGLLSEPMRRLGAGVTGIDAAEQNVRVAGLHAAQSGLDIDYRCVLPEVLAGEGTRFDVVLNMEVVEHVADLDAFHEACCTLVKPGGVMVVSTINRTLKSLALAKVGAEYVLRWIPPGTHDWRKFVRPSELAAGLRAHGVEIVALKGMTYGPLRDDWFLSSDVDVNYLAFAVKG
ncbi:MAG: bifunctional 2-polyprenyl-6-hydroxyphenol methylase/3-demethylubiquinol 3-O-methyltransferase UbiG [Rhodospirillales bacterium]